MAAKPPKPPDNNSNARMVKSIEPERISQDSHQCPPRQGKKSDCSCTNISIRQLFYEMKQIFPTVPDNVVNQCVIDNCHDRENCLKVLNNELATHPTPVQSYPSQAIRGGGNLAISNGGCSPITPPTPSRKPVVPVRPAPVPRPNLKSGGGDGQSIPKQLKSTVNHLKQGFGNRLASVIGNSSNPNNSDMRPLIVGSETPRKPNVPQRPTTLNIREAATTNGPNARTLSRPTRTAPLPPTGVSPGVKNVPAPTPPNLNCSQQPANDLMNQSFSSGASAQSPMSFSDSGESEISVNISLSPSSSDRSRVSFGGNAVAPTRCITTISVQPEPAYTRAISGLDSGMPPTPSTPHRSYTSLNLTLRKPSDSPQSPIDITAGSVLKYSSTRYDAINGCEQNFHITVTDGGGTITSSRIRPRSCHYDPDTIGNTPEQQYTLRTGISMPNVASQNITTGDGSRINVTAAQDEIIRRQQTRKSKLLNEVKNKRQQLEEMNKEINILQSPISPNVCDRLDREIEILRCDCERLCHEINNRNGNAGVSFESVFENIYNGQQAMPARQQPPPIPAALSRFRSRPGAPSPNEYTDPLDQNPYQRSQSYPIPGGAVSSSGGYDQTDYSNANYVDDNGPPWICSMCTFQNYPLLNKCEGCDNVRIIPGTVQIVPSASAPHIHSLLHSSNNASSPHASASANVVAPSVATQSHNATLTSDSVVNNSFRHDHPHPLVYPTAISNSDSSVVQNNNNAGLAPNMHQIVAYPAVLNPNFMIPQ